jgi:bifunctional UDP-N-acetylglucosamine pyrophosphorylase/glucosamine-1-phosphate N-acetyltransferase
MIESPALKNNRPWASIILAAGKGVRMKSALPKVMHHLLGKPLIGHIIDLLKNLNFTQKVVVIGHGSEFINNYLKECRVNIVVQEHQLGTAHATLCAKYVLEEFVGNVLIICGDTPLLRENSLISFMQDHIRSNRTLSLLTAHMSDPYGYGRVLRSASESSQILEIVEEKDATQSQKSLTEINTGIYAVDSTFLFNALGDIGCNNVQGEYYLTDIINIAVSRGFSVGSGISVAEDEALGINSRVDLARAETVLLNRIKRKWMEEGVSFELNNSIYIEPDVMLSRDVIIGAHTVLKGSTTVGEGAKLGAFSYLEGAEVPAYTTIPPFTRLIGV